MVQLHETIPHKVTRAYFDDSPFASYYSEGLNLTGRNLLVHLTETQQAEIAALRATLSETARPTVPALENILHTPFPMLDHGFVRVIDYMGDDAAIVQAARVSYGKGTTRIQEDRGLIRYLRRHRHTTPFEMCEMKFHVKLPIFIARQWIRHRTASVNEYSARYSILDREFYIPPQEWLASQAQTNRQGRARSLSLEEAKRVQEILTEDAGRAYGNYEYMLNDDGNGNQRDPNRDMVARELARMNLPVNFYTQWYWKVNLHNLFHFLGLRADPHAQLEIQAYAEKMLEMVGLWVPLAHEAFLEYDHEGVNLSRTMVGLVRKMLAGEVVTQETSGLTKREWIEFEQAMGPFPTAPRFVPATT